MAEPNNPNSNHDRNNRAKESSNNNNSKNNNSNTPSFLSPVGETSMDYSVAFDDDDEVMGMSPITPSMSMSAHPPLHTDSLNNSQSHSNSHSHSNGPTRHNDRFRENDYEANYGIDNDDQYVFNLTSSDNDDNDLPTPLLGYNYNHEGNANGNNNDNDDDDDDRYHPHNRHDPYEHHHHEDQHQQNGPPKLNGLNYLNVITYVLNVFTSYFIGVRGLFGVLPTRRDIFIEYETLVTPADYAYWLWAPILVFELFFATAQLLPHYRARPIIQQGTGLYFFWACIIQTIWTVFFAMRWFISSFVAVVLALLCLVFLLASQHYNVLCAPTTRGQGGMTIAGFLSSATMPPARQRRKSLLEYWFFRFPFYLHCGWLLVCMVVQFSMVFRYRFTNSSGAQLTADIVALGVMLPPATFFLTGQSSGPDFVIPIVILWSYVSIAVELNKPSDTLVDLYGHAAILAVQNASYVFTGLIGVMLVPRIIVWIAQEFCTIDVVELETDEDNISTTINEVRRGVTTTVNNNGTTTSDSRSGSGSGDGWFSLRRSVDADADADAADNEGTPSDALADGDNGNDNDNDEEDLDTVRRRIEDDEEQAAIAEEGKDENEEEQYEDCQESENASHDE
jgi:hypothetical protein